MQNQVDNELVQFNTGTFTFSGAQIDDLSASEYTLVVICVDKSYSVAPFAKQLQECLKEAISSCQKSPRADNLLVRVVTFGQNVEEVHGFKELRNCDLTLYNNLFDRFEPATSLHDAIVNGVESLADYGKQLFDADYTVNSLLCLVTDGLNNVGLNTKKSVKKALANAVGELKLESLISILVGVNIKDPEVGIELQSLRSEAGFTQYVEIENANQNSLAKLGGFISKSIVSQSKSLGTNAPAKSLTF